MREQHGFRIRWNTVLPSNRRREFGGVDTEQHQVPAARVETIRGQMYLLRGGKVDEALRVERFGPMFAGLLGASPVLGAAQVDENARLGWGRIHTASLPGRQHGVDVRHDTPVKPWGTTPEAKTSDRVEIRASALCRSRAEERRRSHERNSDKPRADQS